MKSDLYLDNLWMDLIEQDDNLINDCACESKSNSVHFDNSSEIHMIAH